jgi:hypothetical protein
VKTFATPDFANSNWQPPEPLPHSRPTPVKLLAAAAGKRAVNARAATAAVPVAAVSPCKSDTLIAHAKSRWPACFQTGVGNQTDCLELQQYESNAPQVAVH